MCDGVWWMSSSLAEWWMLGCAGMAGKGGKERKKEQNRDIKGKCIAKNAGKIYKKSQRERKRRGGES